MLRFAIMLMLAAAALAAPAQAVIISYQTTGAGDFTLFGGTIQQTQLSFTGCPGSFACESSVDLTPGVPVTRISHVVLWPSVGTNDGGFPGPDTIFDIDTLFTVGGESVTLTQSVRYRQIANGQFQLDLGESATQTLNLGGLGFLDITSLSRAVQLRPIDSGGGGVIRSTFLLRAPTDAIPEPASWAMLIAGFGLIGGVMRRRPRVVATMIA